MLPSLTCLLSSVGHSRQQKNVVSLAGHTLRLDRQVGQVTEGWGAERPKRNFEHSTAHCSLELQFRVFHHLKSVASSIFSVRVRNDQTVCIPVCSIEPVCDWNTFLAEITERCVIAVISRRFDEAAEDRLHFGREAESGHLF